MSVLELSSHIFSVARRNKKTVTNLQLHKTLFFTIGLGIREGYRSIEYIRSNYNNDFARWRYGPVVPELYHKYNHYGYRPIEDDGEYFEIFSELDEIISKLLDADAYKMVAISHSMESWYRYKEKIINREYVPRYTFAEIERDFNNE